MRMTMRPLEEDDEGVEEDPLGSEDDISDEDAR